MLRLRLLVSLGLLVSPLALHGSLAAQPSVRQALSLVPMQPDVEYERPGENEIDACIIKPEREGDSRAWVVVSPAGSLLRRFSDSNGDNKIDQWCYFRGGVEVYRDIDADFNEKADQYRWFGTGGLRWGLDDDEDGTLDRWKWISAEEVTSELVRALATRDAARFAKLLVTPTELAESGLSAELIAQIDKQVEAARQQFAEFAGRQKSVAEQSRWVDFSAPQPGVVPGGGEQTKEDLVVYENVIAMVETDGQHGEVQVGTLIRIQDRWRLIGLPEQEDNGFFFRAADRRTLPVASVGSEVDPRLQQLVQKLEELDQQLAKATTPAETTRAYGQRIGVLRELIAASRTEERDMWLLQLIDSVVVTSQSGENHSGIKALESLVNEVAKATTTKEVVAQAKFAFLTANYSDSLQKTDANLAKIQSQWIDDLKQFVDEFGGTRPAAEAMLQLAISEEFAGEDQAAIQWYARIVRDHAKTDMAEKAEGATRRLNSIGTALALQGKNLTGSPMNLSELRGNLVVIHYWATWCEPCKQDIQQLKEMLAVYGRRKFAVVGVNLDNDPRVASAFMQQARITWPQFHEAGGLESSLAKQMGIFTLPVMLLVDEQGRVVNRSLTIAELDSELKKRRSKR